MRTVRSFFVLLVAAAMTGACAGASPGAGSQAPGRSQPAAGSQAPGGSQASAASEAPASFGAGAGGSAKYQISGGGYSDSGELPFSATTGSYFSPGEGAGWIALFDSDPQAHVYYLEVNTDPTSGEEIMFVHGDITADLANYDGSPDACTYTPVENDAAGVVGSMVCTSVELWQGNAKPVLDVTFSVQWNAHP